MSADNLWEPVETASSASVVLTKSGDNKSGWLISTSGNANELKKATAQKTFLGIDFGTSTSVISLILLSNSGGKTCQTLEIEQPTEYGGTIADHLVNTVLAWKNGRLLFGKDAYRLRQDLFEGRNIFSSFKMRLGVDIGPTYPETALKKNQDTGVVIEDANDATRVFFKCLLTALTEVVKAKRLPQELCFAVSVPASFEANQRRDLLENMLAAGLPVSSSCLIDEPNAAYLSFLHEISQSEDSDPLKEQLRRKHTNVLVYDFGAGTCDVSILDVQIADNLVNSRNRAISRFTALGGDDFDRAIARDVLLPQILAQTPGFEPQLRDIEERLLPRLQPTAERLKVSAIKWLTDRNINTLEQMREHQSEPFVDLPVPKFNIREHKAISLDKPTMSLSQLAEAMAPFVGKYNPDYSSAHVFAPVDDALKKSGLKPQELDAVLFIGGSSYNPIVRNAVMSHLPQTVRAIVPKNLQTHVSLGAALHSLSYHAFGHDLIRPITSEPIFVLTRDEGREIIVPASSEVPSPVAMETQCKMAVEGQKMVELPICVSRNDKMLGILRVESSSPAGFRLNDKITIRARITHDKLLEIEAKIDDKRIGATLMNPLANRELSSADQRMLEAKQRFNTALLKYGGKNIPKRVVYEYAEAAMEAEVFELAADMFAGVERLDPLENCAINLCYCYSQAGKTERAREWAKRAHQRCPSSLTAFNLSIWEEGANKESLLRQALSFDPGFPVALCTLGQILLNRSSPEGCAMLQDCVRRLEARLNDNSLRPYDIRTLITAAEALGQRALVNRAKDELDRILQLKHSGASSIYDYDNLAASVDRPHIVERA
ncbi:MAG: Hsp70 family protein [Deltaproteobacteria bacterium]|jgi:molecular chaperone DnaK (HSP70)|nr:Hsp70 family protein [Deltaproteobacteria bacterium]